MNRKLVPDGFQVPELLENERVRLRMLTDLPPQELVQKGYSLEQII